MINNTNILDERKETTKNLLKLRCLRKKAGFYKVMLNVLYYLQYALLFAFGLSTISGAAYADSGIEYEGKMYVCIMVSICTLIGAGITFALRKSASADLYFTKWKIRETRRDLGWSDRDD